MKKKKGLGDCFERSFNLVVFGSHKGSEIQSNHQLFLVHGIVFHEQTGYHVHGWVEDCLFCYDFSGKKLCQIPREFYYEVGKIKTGVGELMKYTAEEAAKLAVEAGVYYFSKLPCEI